MLPTGGTGPGSSDPSEWDPGSTDPADWEARYGGEDTGCLAADTGIDYARDLPSRDAPQCLLRYDDCAAFAVKDYTEPKTVYPAKLGALCECLRDYKECLAATLASLNAQNIDGLPTQGCPSIVISRICAQKELEITSNLYYKEANAWSCAVCSGDAAKLEESATCVNGLGMCTCSTDACGTDDDSSEAGCKCNSIACLLAVMRCWVHDYGCSTLSAWYLCLYDTPALTGSRDDGYSEGYRNLRCKIETCREAITHIGLKAKWPFSTMGALEGDVLAYLHAFFFVFVFIFGVIGIYVVQKVMHKKHHRRLAGVGLIARDTTVKVKTR